MIAVRTYHWSIRSLCLVCVAVFPAATAGCATLLGTPAHREPEMTSIRGGEKEGVRQVTEEELQSELMSFADRFTDTITQASIDFETWLLSPQARIRALRTRVDGVSSALEIAAGPNPGVALLDMVVLVTLKRILWEEYWGGEVFGDAAEVKVEALRKLEADIWSIAAEVLTVEQQQELRDLILEWRESNPGQRQVNFIRFSDFAGSRRRARLADAGRPGGVLGVGVLGVKEATRAVDEVRLLAERAMWLVTRMQLLVNGQAQLAFTRMITTPEVEQALANAGKFTEVAERLAKTMEQLPDEITQERRAALDQLMQQVTLQRKATIEEVADRLAAERKNLLQDLESEEKRLTRVLADLRQTLTAGSELASLVNTTVGSVDSLTARFDQATAAAGSKPFDIKDYLEAVVQVSAATRDLGGLIASVEQLLVSPGWEQRLPQLIQALSGVERGGERWIDHAFYRGLVLILIFLVGAVLAMLVYRYASERLFGSSRR